MVDPREQASQHNQRWFHYGLLLLALLLALMTAALGVAYALWPEHHQTPAVVKAAQPTARAIPSAATVIVSTSLSDPVGATTFPSSTGTFYCKVNLPNLPHDTPITFKWESLPSGNVIFPYTSTYASPLKYTYLTGPEAPGQYRCQIFAPRNGELQILGSASYSVR